MTKSRFLFWLIFSFVSGLLPMQKVAAQKLRGDAVFLKNGSVVTGRITQNDSLSGIKIANECGIWLFKPIEFDSIGSFPGGKYFIATNKGYFNATAFGLLFGIETPPLISINMVQGYKLSTKLTAGIGIGYEYFDWGVLPAFADARYYIDDEGFSPFIFGQIGYSFPLEDLSVESWEGNKRKTFGGILWSAGVGIRVGVSRRSAFTCSVAYRFQKLSHESSNWWDPNYKHRTYINYNRIALTVGFLFE